MRLLTIVAATVAACLLYTQIVHACTTYERQVYDAAKAVEGFRDAHQFKHVYGWGTGGPYHKWLNRIRELSDDNENSLKLLGTHGFVPMEIYSVADEFRTVGGLDGFYQEIDVTIKSLRCR